jgi:solute carrier family 25 2-oxodicarboxylate transporter 21
VKIRLQNKASASLYSGPLDVVAKTIKNEGILALYNGLESTMWRHVLWNAGYFGVIFQVRELLPKANSKQGQVGNDLISGSIGGTVGTLVNTPMDVVKYVFILFVTWRSRLLDCQSHRPSPMPSHTPHSQNYIF